MSGWSTYPRSRVFTSWGTVLYVDPSTGQLRHGPSDSSPANAFFVADPAIWKSRQRGFLANIAGDSVKPIQHPIVAHAANINAQKTTPASSETRLRVVHLERGLVGLEADGVFLSAEADGEITLSKNWCSTWEFFLLCEDWCFQRSEDVQETPPSLPINNAMLQSFIVDPRLRAAARKDSKAKKVLIYGYTRWSHGRVYYDLCKHLHARGYIVDILDWQTDHAARIGEILEYYDVYMTALDGVSTLVDTYKAPYEKIIAISHGELDARMLIEQKGADIFDKFGAYGVVSESLYSSSQLKGIRRIPIVASVGIEISNFESEPPKILQTVGYASSMSLKTFGVELKRGELAQTATHDAGLEFKIAGWTGNQISIHEMPDFYRSVDAIVHSSISESGPLPVLEAAAASRLVICTPVGIFPRLVSRGGGVLAPMDAESFKSFTTETLRHYKDNPSAFNRKCRSARDAVEPFDWQYKINDWIALIESALHHR